jgi:hypothetical protein
MGVSLHDKLDNMQVSPWLFLIQHKCFLEVKFGVVSMHERYRNSYRLSVGNNHLAGHACFIFLLGYLMMLSMLRLT